jgi:GNAT superfamily N-acetyltransferase
MATGRLIHEDELDELLTLYQMLNPADPKLEKDEEVRGQWREIVHDDWLKAVIVEHDGRLVSSCILSITPNLTRSARPFGFIENVVTHEDYQQNGFGTLCLQTAIEIAEENDCYKIMLMTGSDKQWKHEFYERCGFDKKAKTGFELSLR